LASADYCGLRTHNRLVYTADSTEQYETPGVSPLSLAERGKLSQFMTKTPASDTVKELPGYPIPRRLSPQLQFSLSGVTLVYLSQWL
jgi:hypothetical protein